MTTSGETARPVALLQQLSYYPQITERVRTLAGQGHRAEAIARRLHAEGFRPARGRGARISASTVKEILRELGCLPPLARTRPAPQPGEEPGRDEWWLEDLAAELDMPAVTLYSWIYRGWVNARKKPRRPHRWILHAGPTELAELRERRTRPPGWYTRLRWTDTQPPTSIQDGDQTASSHL